MRRISVKSGLGDFFPRGRPWLQACLATVLASNAHVSESEDYRVGLKKLRAKYTSSNNRVGKKEKRKKKKETKKEKKNGNRP